jgi:hypothetical protein
METEEGNIGVDELNLRFWLIHVLFIVLPRHIGSL